MREGIMEPRASDATEERLADWVRSALGKDKAEIAWGAPLGSAKSPTVSLTLLEIIPTPTPRMAEKPPLRLKLRYVLSVQAPDPQEAHRLLIALAFSAMDETDWDVELGSLPPGVWEALGVPLQPSILLNVPLLKERPAMRISRVRVPLVLETGSIRAITGTVLGPGEIPIMGARVELPSLGRAARTDQQGRFRLSGIPAGPAPSSLRVRAKGVETSVDLGALAPSGDQPLVIHLNPLED
jgi:hypothetical protein